MRPQGLPHLPAAQLPDVGHGEVLRPHGLRRGRVAGHRTGREGETGSFGGRVNGWVTRGGFGLVWGL